MVERSIKSIRKILQKRRTSNYLYENLEKGVIISIHIEFVYVYEASVDFFLLIIRFSLV